MANKRAPAREPWQASFRAAGPYLGVGMQLAATMLVFTVGGIFADRRLESSPWLTLAGAALGILAVFTYLFRMNRQMSADGKAKTASEKPPAP